MNIQIDLRNHIQRTLVAVHPESDKRYFHFEQQYLVEGANRARFYQAVITHTDVGTRTHGLINRSGQWESESHACYTGVENATGFWKELIALGWKVNGEWELPTV